MYRKNNKEEEVLAQLKYETLSHDDAIQLQYELKKEKTSRLLFWGYTLFTFVVGILIFGKSTWIWSVLLFIAWLFVFIKRLRKHKLDLVVWFGIPGSGKTTTAAKLTAEAWKKGIPTYSNCPLAGAYKLDPLKDLGFSKIENAQIIIDEAGIDYNSRKFKSMPQENIEWLKYHRHYKCNVHVFSQSYEDMDITFRRLAARYYLLKRSIIPGLFLAYPIRRSIGINEMTQEICDKYKFDPKIIRFFTAKKVFGRKYWKMFDSYDAPKLPEKEFSKWSGEEIYSVDKSLDAEKVES